MNKQERKIYNQNYYQTHKEKILKQHTEYRKNYIPKPYKWNNRIKYLQGKKRHYKKHKKEILEYRRKRYKKLYGTNLSYTMRRRIGSRITDALKHNSKALSTFQLLGCNINYLKQYLENQFKKGMTWDNYGIRGWHIDHIKPCCTFDLSKPEEQKKCFHYTNLQPLWAKENYSKKEKDRDKYGGNDDTL